MSLEYLVSFIVSYIIGSLPTAYLVVKRTSDVDIRTVGSGNVGGRNALEVTGKKWVGVVVTTIDIVKGIASIAVALAVSGGEASAVSAAMVGSVVGHCYPVWLKFRGGRGLATAAGVMLATSWIWNVVWLGLYFASEKATKNVHAASIIALVGVPLTMWCVPESWLRPVLPEYFSAAEFFSAGSLMIAVCLSRHLEPLKEYFHETSS